MKKILTLLVLIMAFMSCEETETVKIKTEAISFYNWDMTNNNSLTVLNYIDAEKINSYHVQIYKDFDTHEFKMFNLSSDEYSIIKLDNGKFIITVTDGGFFDSEKFNSIDQVRGAVIVKYY